jgi:hypothetical protein
VGTVFGFLVRKYREKIKSEKKLLNEVEGLLTTHITEGKEKANLREITTPKPNSKPAPQKTKTNV